MKIFCGALLIGFVVFGVRSQTAPLPNDFRQQNITEYNSSLLNPAYALDRNNAPSVALWARWQWQTYDGDPTSLFFNYTGKLNEASALGGAFFQNNTGIFINTGGAINYAYALDFSPKVRLGIGLNLFAFQQKLADDRFFIPNPIQTEPTNDFVLQMAPGINLRVDKFNIGFVSENMFDYNFSTSERNTSPSDRIFFGLASYDIPVELLNSEGSSYLRPALYFKSIPGFDTQFGLNTILSTQKFWAQAGYNSFYGISGGVGGRFFKRFSVGALVEFGTSPELKNTDPTFELVTSYRIGSLTQPDQPMEQLLAEKEKEEMLKEELKASEKLTKQQKNEQDRADKIKAKMVNDSIAQSIKKVPVLAVKESKRELRRKADSINKAKAELAFAEMIAIKKQRQQDSINTIKKAEEQAIALALQRKQDSLTELANEKAEAAKLAMKNEVVKPKAGERYEEVTEEGSLEPGYYLIANVFGTKRYFDAFMADMKKRGIPAGSFFREANKYNYVYLSRYNSIDEARKARESKFDGKYQEKTWIFRVTGK